MFTEVIKQKVIWNIFNKMQKDRRNVLYAFPEKCVIFISNKIDKLFFPTRHIEMYDFMGILNGSKRSPAV